VIKCRRIRIGGEEDIYNILVWKPEGKRSLGRPKRRWDGNIKIRLQEFGCGSMNCLELALDRGR